MTCELTCADRTPTHKKSLQVMFDPPPIFTIAKTVAASNAADFRLGHTGDIV